jgi:3-oxoacyl-[acyl-carrier protein] reductase
VELGLSDKVALVAASSRGLGYAIAHELAAEGAAVVMCARGEERLQQAAREIAQATGARVVAVAGDVAKPADVERVTRRAIGELGRVDVLVTNSGGPPAGTFESTSPDAWKAAVDVLLTSAVELVRAVLPGMKERRFGRILNVTSITVKQPVENLILSNALRAAVTGMARTLASEAAPFGITVNNLLPGYTRTQRLSELADATAARGGGTAKDFYARLEAEIPARRLGEPRELAALAAFLASERAAYITGQSIAVDGGWIRGLF